MINTTKFLRTDKAPFKEVYFRECNKYYRLETKRLSRYVKDFNTAEEWKYKIKSYQKKLPVKTTKCRKAIMDDFIGAIIDRYIRIIFEELQHGNTIELGGSTPYALLSFKFTHMITKRKNKKIKLHYFLPRLELLSPFKKTTRVKYIGKMNKITFYQQIIKQLKNHDARIIHNTGNSIS